MHSGRVDFEQLQFLSKVRAPAAVARWLTLEGVAFSLDERALPWTTLAAIERRGRRRRETARYPCADLALEM